MLQTYKTVLSAKNQLTPDIYFLKFDLVEPKEFSFIPGQYMIMRVPPDQLARLYSIASSTEKKNSFELIIKIEPMGKASTYVLNMKTGDEVTFEGPAGIFQIKDTSTGKIFMATGTGIAPIRSMLRSEVSKLATANYYLFWGLPTYRDVYLFDELKNLNKESAGQFNFKICLSREVNLDMIPEEDRQYFAIGHIDKCLEENTTNYEFYLCGSRHVTDSLREHLLTEKHIPSEQLMFEKF